MLKNKTKLLVLVLGLVGLGLPKPVEAQSWKSEFVKSLKNGGVLVEGADGKVLLEHRSKDLFIPASTQKIATAATAINTLGLEYHFQTDFLVTPKGELCIKGYGDPSLISEEIVKIVQNLKSHGFKKATGLILDDSFFDEKLNIDGQAQSGRAYDAGNGALVANFNTIYVKKLKNGQVVSGEPQTPVTPTALKKAKAYKKGVVRVSLGNQKHAAALYFGEIFAAIMKREGLELSGKIEAQKTPDDAKLFYQHYSYKSLKDVLRSMLDFSTNFTANQLFLISGAKVYGGPATVEKGQKVMTEFLTTKVGLKNTKVFEGSGLSRSNKISPSEMLILLDYFTPYQKLLDFKDGVFHAKTGTLNGVNTYAGYVDLPSGSQARFAIFVNDVVPFDHKFVLARKLYKGLTGKEVPIKDKGRSAEGYEGL